MAEKELIGQHEYAFTADPKGLFAMLQSQFSNPLLAFRELVQNAADESPSRITITADYGAHTNWEMRVSIEDDGNGMDLAGIRRYLTLFDSTKENDPTKVGQIGVGKLSLYVLRPSRITVETGKGSGTEGVSDGVSEGYTLELDSRGGGNLYRTAPRKGTKISAVFPNWWDEGPELIEEIVRDTCKYVTTPITVNGKTINSPFEASGRYGMKIDEAGLEAIISLRDTPSRQYFRGRILLEEERPEESDPLVRTRYQHLGLLVNSTHFEPTISRNRAVRDPGFFAVRKLIQQALDQFYATIAQDCLHGKTPKSDFEFLRTCLLEHITTLSRGAQMKPFAELPFFDTMNLGRITYQQIADSHRKERKLHGSAKWHSAAALSYFTERKIPVFSYSSEEETRTDVQKFLRYHFNTPADISVELFADPTSYRALDPHQQAYVTLVNKILASGTLPLPKNGKHSRSRTLRQATLGTLIAAHKTNTTTPYAPKGDKLVLNQNHPFIQQTIDTSRRHPETAALYLLGEILADDELYQDTPEKEREDALLRLAENLASSAQRNGLTRRKR